MDPSESESKKLEEKREMLEYVWEFERLAAEDYIIYNLEILEKTAESLKKSVEDSQKEWLERLE